MTFSLRQLFLAYTLVAVYVGAWCVSFQFGLFVHAIYAAGFVVAALCDDMSEVRAYCYRIGKPPAGTPKPVIPPAPPKPAGRVR